MLFATLLINKIKSLKLEAKNSTMRSKIDTVSANKGPRVT